MHPPLGGTRNERDIKNVKALNHAGYPLEISLRFYKQNVLNLKREFHPILIHKVKPKPSIFDIFI